MRRRFVFVMEQTLGHIAHTRNLERALAREDWFENEIVRLPFEPVGACRLPVLRNWTLRASVMTRSALRRRLHRGPVDGAFIHTQVASLLSTGIMRSVPTVLSLDATPLNFDVVGGAYGHRRGNALGEAAKALINRRAFLSAVALVTWSQKAADSLTSDYGVPAARIHVIPPGVDTGRFRPAERPRPEGPIRVLFVGGNFHRKGGQDLLVAMSGLPEVELDLVTASPVESVPSSQRCRVHRGLKPGDAALVELYRNADIFALPSHGDCLPQALAEAAAVGLPLVATSTGAVTEIVKHGLNGFVVPVGSISDLQVALRTLVERPDRRRAMGRESLTLARQHHDAMTNFRRIFDLMGEAAGLWPARRLALTIGRS